MRCTPLVETDELLVQVGQVERCRQDIEVADAGLPHHLLGWHALGDYRAEVELDLILGQEHLAGVGLGVAGRDIATP